MGSPLWEKQQFIRYKQAHIQGTPKTLEEFQKLKKNSTKWEDMKRRYHLHRYNKLDDSIAKPVQPPKLTSKQLKKILEIPVYRRIGLSKKQYENDDIIKPYERDFAKRITEMGFRIKWIPRNSDILTPTGGYLPTNDFVWNHLEFELKKPLKKKYKPIYNRIKEGRDKGKVNFVIDLGNSILNRKLVESLTEFNIRKDKNRNKIEKLYILDKKQFVEIILK